MRERLSMTWELLRQISVVDIIDILLLTVLIYQLIKLTRESKASQVLKGLGVLLVVSQVSKWLHLMGLSQLLSYIMNSGVIVMVVLFQPELRRGLERLGAGKILDNPALRMTADDEAGRIISELEKALQSMAKSKTGALLVFQKNNTLEPIIETGTVVDARISQELIENIFFKNSPLHDGATIINGTRILASGCFLPMTGNNNELSHELGTRHRAALGMSEQTDALIIVVSEETGIISMVEGGKLQRYLDMRGIRQALNEIYQPKQASKGLSSLIKRRNSTDENE